MLYLMTGIPASGKTTYIKISMCPKISHKSRDEVRFSMLNDKDDYFAKEKKVFEKWIEEIQTALDEGKDVVADATHLTPQSRKKTLDHLDLGEHGVTAINFLVPVEKCLERNEKRVGRAYVPREVIRRMFHQYKPAKKGEDPRITSIWEIKL